MTLEDFFTLTELKDGLTSPARVKELITAMQKEKNCVVKNVGDATRQWSTVANIIAVTESKDCLDLFVQSDGLWFIDRWLNDAQKFRNDSGTNFVEESTTALLRALERLQIDNRSSVSSGLRRTVQNLLGHSDSEVRDKAKTLCDRWTQMQDAEAPQDDGTNSSVAVSPSSRNDNEEKSSEQSRDDMLPSVCFDTGQQVNKEETPTAETMDPATTKQEPLDPVDPPGISQFVGGDISVKFETDESKSQGTALTGTPGSTPTMQLDVSRLDKHVVDAKEKHEIDFLDKAGGVEMSILSKSLEQGDLPLGADVNDVLESAIKTDLREDTSDKDEDMVDSNAGAMQDSPGDDCKWGVAACPNMYSNTESDSRADDAKKQVGAQSENDSGIGSHFSKPSTNAQGGGLMSKRSDMELDYGMVDPLEVARRVAIEVEREVDSRERSCSTSEKMSGGGTKRRPKSPDSTNGKESQPTEGSGKQVSSGPGPSPKAVHGGAEPVNDAETVGSDHKRDIAASQVSEVAQESQANTERGFSGFDLNQEVCSEEIDCPIDSVSTPISVVSASRAVVAAVSPVAPLQFEGTHGWKGSATTSAFRRIPDGSLSGNPNNPKQRLDCLNIDLNVAEDSEDKIEDYSSRNKNPMTSGLPSGEESSVEASPRRSVRLQLDLNSLGDGSVDTVVLDWRQDGRVAFLNQNGHQSPSQSSSSSSMQPSMRNIDLNLNDQSIFPNDASLDHRNLGKLFNNSTASRGVHSRDESVISLFGTQVEVKQKDVVPQPNGRILEPVIDFGLGRNRASWGLGSSMAVYGHNGFPSGPSMYFPSPYGPPGAPSPYIVDSRGVPVAPQFMGSSLAVPPTFSQQPPPFLMNMAAGVAGTSFGSNGAGPSQHNFDLNSGFMINGGNKENRGGLRQLLTDNQGSSVDERYSRANHSLQASSSSVVGGKRQEPDSGWEAFPNNYKHQPPPWK